MKLLTIDAFKAEKITTILSQFDYLIRYTEQFNESYNPENGYLNYHSLFDLIYIQFTDLTNHEVREMFRSPSDPNKEKICAWISKESGYRYTGFIPDSIDELIINSKLAPEIRFRAIHDLFALLNHVFANRAYSEIKTPINIAYVPTVF